MSEFNASNLRKEHGNEGPDLVGITTLTSQHYMVPPSGTTGDRPQNPQPGTLRFNTDIGNLEYFKGNTLGWESINRNPNQRLQGGTRALWAGGGNGNPYAKNISYTNISILDNFSIDFGNLSAKRFCGGSASSYTRGVWMGGGTPTRLSLIEYNTIASKGDAIDFGSTLGAGGSQGGSISNGIRGLYAGMSSGSGIRDTIEGITIASTGTFDDYGDLHAVREQCTGSQSTTRGIICGGITPSSTNVIEYVTIMTEGDAVDFGDLTRSGNVLGAGTGSSTRMLIGGGANPSITNVIDYITISTLGNSSDFGDLTDQRSDLASNSDNLRAVWAGGLIPAASETMDYVQITTTGNASNFGDLVSVSYLTMGACSSGHGGLI